MDEFNISLRGAKADFGLYKSAKASNEDYKNQLYDVLFSNGTDIFVEEFKKQINIPEEVSADDVMEEDMSVSGIPPAQLITFEAGRCTQSRRCPMELGQHKTLRTSKTEFMLRARSIVLREWRGNFKGRTCRTGQCDET